MTESVRIDLLGSLVVRCGERVLDGGPVRQQAVLAALALRANELVTAEYLLDAVWGADRPEIGAKVIPPYIYRIRSALAVNGILESSSRRYVLHLEHGCLDVDRFEAAVQAGEESDSAAEAAERFGEALALWRGEPLEGLPGLAAHRKRLVERRHQALASRVDADLRCGRHAEVIAELSARVYERRFDERLVGQLMVALHRSGRRREALDAYLRTRTFLVDELGSEPGPELRRIQHEVLSD